MNFGVIEDCNFIMSYCELVNKIKAEPLKYIDEYNLLYLYCSFYVWLHCMFYY